MDHGRHLGIFVVPPFFSVALIGAGGIGAAAGLALAKMGVRWIEIWDDDTVDGVNIATQLHQVSDIGRIKGEALMNTMQMFSDEVDGKVHPERVTDLMNFNDLNLVVSAVDSISARKDIWQAVLNSEGCNWYLDTRMAAEQYQHFLVDLQNQRAVDAYSALLDQLSDENVVDAVCTEKSTIFCAFMSAGHVGKVMRDIVSNRASSHRLIHYIVQEEILKFKI